MSLNILNSNKKSSTGAKILPQFSISSGNKPLLDLLEIQRKSFFDFLQHGIPDELAKIAVFRETAKNSTCKQELELKFNPETYKFISPNFTPKEAILNGKTYACKVYVQATLMIRSPYPLAISPSELSTNPVPLRGTETPVSFRNIETPAAYPEGGKQALPRFASTKTPAATQTSGAWEGRSNVYVKDPKRVNGGGFDAYVLTNSEALGRLPFRVLVAKRQTLSRILAAKRQTPPRSASTRGRVQRILVAKRQTLPRFASMRGGVQRFATTSMRERDTYAQRSTGGANGERGKLLVRKRGGSGNAASKAQNIQIFRPWIFLGELPLMTKRGHFILNGSPRVIVNQIARCPGIYFQEKRRGVGIEQEIRVSADLIPQRGPWLRIQSDWEGRFWARLKQEGRVKYATLYEAFQEFEKEYNPPLICLLSNSYSTNTTSSLFSKAENITFQERKIKEDRQKKALIRLFKNSSRYSLGKLGRSRVNERIHSLFPEWNSGSVKQKVATADFLGSSSGEALGPTPFHIPRKGKYTSNREHSVVPLRGKSELLAKLRGIDISVQNGGFQRNLSLPLTKRNRVSHHISIMGRRSWHKESIRNLSTSSINLSTSPIHLSIPSVLYNGAMGKIPFCKHFFNEELMAKDLDAIHTCLERLLEGQGFTDDIDNLKNRFIRTSGKLLQQQFELGLFRLNEVIMPLLGNLLPDYPRVARKTPTASCFDRTSELAAAESKHSTNKKINGRTPSINASDPHSSPVSLRDTETPAAYVLTSEALEGVSKERGKQVLPRILAKRERSDARRRVLGILVERGRSDAALRILALPLSRIREEPKGGKQRRVRRSATNMRGGVQRSATTTSMRERVLLTPEGLRSSYPYSYTTLNSTEGKLAQRRGLAQQRLPYEEGLRSMLSFTQQQLSYPLSLQDTNLFATQSFQSEQKAHTRGAVFTPTEERSVAAKRGIVRESCTGVERKTVDHTLPYSVESNRLVSAAYKEWSGRAKMLTPLLSQPTRYAPFFEQLRKPRLGVEPERVIKNAPFRWLRTSKPINSAFREFFGSNPLSQYMDQTNPLAEITHKRRLSSMGPGGIKRETAGMEVRGIHPTHYGRVCPIETPEGKNAGLVNSPTVYGRVGNYGFLETPLYQVIENQVQTKRWTFFSAHHEEKQNNSLATCDTGLLQFNFLAHVPIPVQTANNPLTHFQQVERHRVGYRALSPLQTISIATALIPFLEHDDANRALMGSNMQRQAIPLLLPERPIVGTGFEPLVVIESGQALQAIKLGCVSQADANSIIVHTRYSMEKSFPQNVLQDSKGIWSRALRHRFGLMEWRGKHIANTNSMSFCISKRYWKQEASPPDSIGVSVSRRDTGLPKSSNSLPLPPFTPPYSAGIQLHYAYLPLWGTRNGVGPNASLLVSTYVLNPPPFRVLVVAKGQAPQRILAERERVPYAWGGKEQRSVEDPTRYAPLGKRGSPLAKRDRVMELLLHKKRRVGKEGSGVRVSTKPIRFVQQIMERPKGRACAAAIIFSQYSASLEQIAKGSPYKRGLFNRMEGLRSGHRFKETYPCYPPTLPYFRRFLFHTTDGVSRACAAATLSKKPTRWRACAAAIVSKKSILTTPREAHTPAGLPLHLHTPELRTGVSKPYKVNSIALPENQQQQLVGFFETNTLRYHANKEHISYSHNTFLLQPLKQDLQFYERSNQETCLNQRPLVQEGDWIQKGDFLADSSASHSGDLALGKNVTVAYMPWEGYNFEDAIVISDRLVSDDVYTSLHIERYEIKVSKNSQGKERITNRVPGTLHSLKHLDNFGIARISSWVQPGDILVGKVVELKRPLFPYERLAWELASRLSPKSPEREKWLNKVWLEDISLRLPPGVCGRVINSQIISTASMSDKEMDSYPQEVHIYLAVKRKIQIGDKLAGRHGNKGIVSAILPQEDMPYLGDGSCIDMVLNPLGVPSRMNLGQIFECLLGLAGSQLGCNFRITPFDEIAGGEASRSLVFLKLYQCRLMYKQQWLFTPTFPGKSKLFDGRTGEPFENWVTVGQAYMLKLIHMVDHKIHARSTGPYSLFTRQPVRGRSRRGGQRLGEMEVWAVEGFGAAYTLQEFLTIKSDDLKARTALQKGFYKQNDVTFGKIHIAPGNPEAFKVLLSELQALCLHIQM